MDLKKWPENGWALAGLKDALMIQGEEKEAEEVQERLSKAWANADVPIPAPGSSIAAIRDQKLEVSKR
jgi:CO dehydrogenase/acetyl-CoA synthase epsilon subunit